MKTTLLLLAGSIFLLTGCAVQRYSIIKTVNGKNRGILRLDTVSGKTWKLTDSNWEPVFEPRDSSRDIIPPEFDKEKFISLQVRKFNLEKRLKKLEIQHKKTVQKYKEAKKADKLTPDTVKNYWSFKAERMRLMQELQETESQITMMEMDIDGFPLESESEDIFFDQ